MSRARSLAAACTFLLLALQWAWRAGAPGSLLPWWLAALLFSLPLLPPALAFMLGRPRAPLWAGVAALFYFCHGVTEARMQGGAWPWLEIALSVLLVFAAGWPGIAAKIEKRRAASGPNV